MTLVDVLVLAGGPDAERPVSLASARGVAAALRGEGFGVHLEVIERTTVDALRRLPGEVIFPVLHGQYGEGGPLQDVLEEDGRSYVGSDPSAARAAMDKMHSKLVASALNISTAPAAVLNPHDAVCPISLPVVVKPIHDGSSVGLHLCHTERDWSLALESVRGDGRHFMVEKLVAGRELTVGLIGEPGALEALPIVEIAPAQGTYDYQAKYERSDTRYTADPEVERDVAISLRRDAARLAEAIGVRHVARVDFMLDDDEAWLLEINTMPGFTESSLLPMAGAADGMNLGTLCRRLVTLAAGQPAPVV